MSSPSGTIFYGLWVTTSSLNFASTAHRDKSLQSTLLTIDLIARRWRTGKLNVKRLGSSTTAADLPEEIWRRIKLELLVEAIDKAEASMLAKLRCTQCWEDDLSRAMRGPRVKGGLDVKIEHDWVRWGEPRCSSGGCYDNVVASKVLYHRSTQQREDIANLLQDHGLQLASRRMWSKDPNDSFDFHSLSAIAFFTSALSPSKPSKKSTRAKASSTTTNTSTTINIPPESFVLPSGAQTRIRHLVSEYGLQVVEPKGAVDLVSAFSYADLRLKSKATKGYAGGGAAMKAELNGKEKASFEPDELRWVFWKEKEELGG